MKRVLRRSGYPNIVSGKSPRRTRICLPGMLWTGVQLCAQRIAGAGVQFDVKII
jgi:hypothetical protein